LQDFHSFFGIPLWPKSSTFSILSPVDGSLNFCHNGPEWKEEKGKKMQARPTAIELLEAVRQHLTGEILPTVQAPRLRFQTLVAANVLAVVRRELALAEEQSRSEWQRLVDLLATAGDLPSTVSARREAIAILNQRLCRLIEDGAFDDEAGWRQLLAHCQRTAREKLAVSNPGFLQRLEE
jgi:hypothetical protein